MENSADLNPIIAKYFQYYRLILMIFGTWPISKTYLESYIKVGVYLISDTVNIMEIAAQIAGIPDYRDVLVFSEQIVTAGIEGIIIAKNLVFFLKRKQLRNLILRMDDLYTSMPIKPTAKFTETLEKDRKRCETLVKYFFASTGFCCLVYDAIALLRTYKSGECMLPHRQIYPFDICNGVTYWLLYVMTIFIGFRTALHVGGELLYVSFILLLKNYIELLLEVMKLSIQEARIHKKATPLFGEYIKYQRKVYSTCEALQEFYTPALICQFCFNIVIMCMLEFLSVQVKDPRKLILFFIIDIVVIANLFLFCYFAQQLQSKREWLSNEAYFLPWYTTPVSYQRSYKFALMRSIKNPEFQILGFININMETFQSIVKTSMSYYALLVSMKDGESH